MRPDRGEGETKHAAFEHRIHGDRDHHADQNTEMCIGSRQHMRQEQCVGNLRGIGIGRARLHHRAADDETDEMQGDEVQQQRHDDLVDPLIGLEQRRDKRPQSAAKGARQGAQDNVQRTRNAGQIQRHDGGKQGADIDLAFGADIEQPCPQGQYDGQSRKQQRAHLDQRRGKPPIIEKRPLKQVI